MAFCQHRMHWICCKTKRGQWPAYGARALCSVFSLRGLEQRVDRDRSSGRAVRFASSNLKQLTCIQAFYIVSILTQSTCKKWGIWYNIYIYVWHVAWHVHRRRDGKSQRREEKRREEERRSKKRKSQKKEGPGARNGRKVAKRCVFPMICGSGGSKSRLAKAAGAGPCGQMRDEKLHAVEKMQRQ